VSELFLVRHLSPLLSSPASCCAADCGAPAAAGVSRPVWTAAAECTPYWAQQGTAGGTGSSRECAGEGAMLLSLSL